LRILLVNNEKDKDDFGRIPELKKNISQIVDAEFVVKHFHDVTFKDIAVYSVDYIILSGRFNSSWGKDEEPLFQGEYDLIRNCNVPLLGICAGMQLIGVAYGSKMDYICPIEKEKLSERDYVEVKLLQKDKIFKGLTSPIVVYEHHYCEIKDVSPGFIHLAASSLTPIQCIKDKDRNVYGVQFHPELYNDDYRDGRIILENFFLFC